MNATELAVLRDQVARARLAPRPKRWSSERVAAGESALAAIREANRRADQRRKRRRVVAIPAPVLRLAAKPSAPVRSLPKRPCVYCGGNSLPARWPNACHAHTDLPFLDPAYQGELLLRGVRVRTSNGSGRPSVGDERPEPEGA